jgi:hypothetical protein
MTAQEVLQEEDMSKDRALTEKDFHKKTAVDLFNLVWDLLDKEERTKSEDDTMVHAAHGSRYHWGEVGTPVELERGEWQISRVYSTLNRAESALYHALRCLEICQENDIGGFDIAFAYEAVVRAHAVAGSRAEMEEYLELAKEAGQRIEKKEDREYFMNELKGIPD